MPKVICSLPNAALEISGVKFAAHADGGLISEEISAEQAEVFASIKGYVIEGAEPAGDGDEPPAPTPAPTAKPAAGKKAAKPAAPAPTPAPTLAPVVATEPDSKAEGGDAPAAVEEAAAGGSGSSDDDTVF